MFHIYVIFPERVFELLRDEHWTTRARLLRNLLEKYYSHVTVPWLDPVWPGERASANQRAGGRDQDPANSWEGGTRCYCSTTVPLPWLLGSICSQLGSHKSKTDGARLTEMTYCLKILSRVFFQSIYDFKL